MTKRMSANISTDIGAETKKSAGNGRFFDIKSVRLPLIPMHPILHCIGIFFFIDGDIPGVQKSIQKRCKLDFLPVRDRIKKLVGIALTVPKGLGSGFFTLLLSEKSPPAMLAGSFLVGEGGFEFC